MKFVIEAGEPHGSITLNTIDKGVELTIATPSGECMDIVLDFDDVGHPQVAQLLEEFVYFLRASGKGWRIFQR